MKKYKPIAKIINNNIPEVKCKVPERVIKSTVARVKVDFGAGLPMVNVLESTTEGT